MLLLVDGYNVTMRDPATGGLDKESQRVSLMRSLGARAFSLAPRGRIVVVFDARGQLGAVAEDRGTVQAVYAPDADDEIVARCSSAAGEVTVVTDDLRLRARISQDVGRHVRYRDASTVFHAAARGTGRTGNVDTRGEGDLPAGADDITREMRELWDPES